MTLIINPGSNISPTVENTYERAQQYAQEWHAKMLADGFGDVELIDTGEEREGRWRFLFRHTVTGVEIALDQHGIDDITGFIFEPRVYWNGSSCSNPSIEQFAADGFVMTYRPSPHQEQP